MLGRLEWPPRFLGLGLAEYAYMPQHTSLEIFQNCTREALALYGLIDHFEPESEARVSIWYGAI